MKRNTTALALPVMPAVHPKPTKTEVVEAMLVRARFKHDEENERRKVEREKIEKKLDALALKTLKKGGFAPSVYYYPAGRHGLESHVDMKFSHVTSPELVVLIDKLGELGRLQWNEREVKESIKYGLAGMEKPASKRILEDAQAVKAIDALLDQWSGKTLNVEISTN